MIDLRPMSETEFVGFKALIIEDYAQDMARAYRAPIEEARARSAGHIDSLLNAGLATANHFLYHIVLDGEPDETVVGSLWVEVDAQKSRCFICDIYIQEGHRGQGWGKATLQLLEARLQAQGIARIGLHVFGHNAIARDLYAKLGYQVTDLNMQKWLADADG